MVGLFKKELNTEIIIEAQPQRIWDVLTDFDSYSEWNPFIDHIDGTLAEGEILMVRFASSGSKGRIFRPKLLRIAVNRELRWLGHFLLPLLFDGEHYFRMEEDGGRTRFIQGEVFRGLLVPLFWQYLDTNTRSGFEKMNRALKAVAEGTG